MASITHPIPLSPLVRADLAISLSCEKSPVACSICVLRSPVLVLRAHELNLFLSLPGPSRFLQGRRLRLPHRRDRLLFRVLPATLSNLVPLRGDGQPEHGRRVLPGRRGGQKAPAQARAPAQGLQGAHEAGGGFPLGLGHGEEEETGRLCLPGLGGRQRSLSEVRCLRLRSDLVVLASSQRFFTSSFLPPSLPLAPFLLLLCALLQARYRDRFGRGHRGALSAGRHGHCRRRHAGEQRAGPSVSGKIGLWQSHLACVHVFEYRELEGEGRGQGPA